MKTPLFRFRVNNYKTINQACFDIQGMTILTGPSGSGKTSLLNFVSKGCTCLFLYETLAQEEAANTIKEIVEDLYRIVSSHTNLRLKNSIADPSRRKTYPRKYWEKVLDDLQRVYDKEYPDIEQRADGKKVHSKKIYRNVDQDGEYSLKSLCKIVCPDVASEKLEFPELIEYIRKYCEETLAKEELRLSKRVSDYLPDIFWKLYRQEIVDVEFNIFQKDRLIVSRGIPSVGKMELISKVYDMTRTDIRPVFEYQGASDYFMHGSWFKDKNKERVPNEYEEEIRDLLHTAMRGTVSWEAMPSEKNPNRMLPPSLVFKRDDGVLIAPGNCETGLRTFLLLYRMLDEGLLTEDKLIVFDQPGTFLGSERIVHFARLVCMIQKYCGVKFLFATNVREMINALQKAAEEFELGEVFMMYESRETETPFKYDYHLLK